MDNRELMDILSAHDVRPTQQRLSVYRYLTEYRNHPSADMIYTSLSAQFPVFSRTTIYNALNTFLEAGLVRLVTITPDEQRFDANMSEHGHFLCHDCGKIYDFPIEGHTISGLCPEGFSCSQSDVFLTGECAVCGKIKN